MLIVIAGATGTLGHKLVASALSRNHQVRALGRSPAKMHGSLREQLESFVVCKAYNDLVTLDQACSRADAVICAYTGLPELQVDAQLLLLRSAEKAGIKRFIANCWNYDWRKLELGQHETYDPPKCFCRQAELSSSINPVYIYTGVLAEVLFSTLFTTKYNGIWDPDNKQFVTYGTGDEVWHVTTYADAAEYTIEILQLPEVADGGFFSFASFAHSTKELADIYGKARGLEVPVKLQGSVSDLRKVAQTARENGEVRKYFEYIGWFYQLYTLDGTWVLHNIDNGRFPHVKNASLEDFLKENRQI
ncbi:MAG: hypothetical protein Q9227_000148 [Pyrenula ochraceoflavens]